MKIGIISINMYSKGLNFACPLHTYAFQQFLLNNGIDSTVIDYKPIYYANFNMKNPFEYYTNKCIQLSSRIASTKEDLQKNEEKLAIFTEKRDAWEGLVQEREIRYEKFQNFIKTHYIKTDICYNSDLLEVLDPGFDCYICATDVIWKNEPGFGFDRGFFLASKAMENKWKFSYAASRGVYFAQSPEEEATFFHYLQDIDRISVREPSLQKYIEQNSDLHPTLVLDPVLLHEKEFYDKISVKPQEEHYLLLYYVMEKATDTIKQAVCYAKAHNLKIVEITDRPIKGGRIKNYPDIDSIFYYEVGIEEWLGYIQYADCIFTNSFHACCFSILFEKEFFVGFRHGDKVTNILQTFGLSNRRITSDSNLIDCLPEKINYSIVRELLRQKRKESSDFILSAIHEAEASSRPPRDYESYKKAITYPVFHNTRMKSELFTWNYTDSEGKVKLLPSHNLEYQPNSDNAVNNGSSPLPENKFRLEGYQFKGWYLRICIDNHWFWLLSDGSLKPKKEYCDNFDSPIRLFKDRECIPYIPVNHISLMVAEAIWEKEPQTYRILYNTKKKSRDFSWIYQETDGIITKLDSGTLEYTPNNSAIYNNGLFYLQKNGFSLLGNRFKGWQLRIKIKKAWFWYLNDGTLVSKESYDRQTNLPIKIFSDESQIPYIPANNVSLVVAEAVWEKLPKPCKILYNSQKKNAAFTWTYKQTDGSVKKLDSGSLEYTPNNDDTRNDILYRFRKNQFFLPGYQFKGWQLRVKIKNEWFWYLNDHSLAPQKTYCSQTDLPRQLFLDEATIPDLLTCGISLAVAEAVWEKNDAYYHIFYHCQQKILPVTWSYSEIDGKIRKHQKGVIEYQPYNPMISNDHPRYFLKNKFFLKGHDFVGWRVLLQINNNWFWYLEDGTLAPKSTYNKMKNAPVQIFPDEAAVPVLPATAVTSMIAEAVWQKNIHRLLSKTLFQ